MSRGYLYAGFPWSPQSFFFPQFCEMGWTGEEFTRRLSRIWLQIWEKSRILLKAHHIYWRHGRSYGLNIWWFQLLFIGPQNMLTLVPFFSPKKNLLCTSPRLVWWASLLLVSMSNLEMLASRLRWRIVSSLSDATRVSGCCSFWIQ